MPNIINLKMLTSILAVILPFGVYSYVIPLPAPTNSIHKSVVVAEAQIQPKSFKSNVLSPSADGTVCYSSSSSTIDASNAGEGYVMVKYSGSSPKVKLQITRSGRTTYTYNINSRTSYEVFPLSDGSGTYTVSIFENVVNDQYALDLSKEITANITNQTSPFLYPNQYINFNKNSTAVAKCNELVATVTNELDVVSKIYNYVIENISYDEYKASTVKSGYLPDIDKTLSSKKGICFDYAALMVAMLRSQNIPTKLIVGYTSGGIYHAWLSTYITDIGWVDGIIYFDGQSWQRVDPTFAANNKGSQSINEFIGNGSNYTAKYIY